MFRPRVIPCRPLRKTGLVKTVQFKHPKYLGDPINIVKIFNEKEVDELVVLDITATVEGRSPSFELVEKVASEAFMPVGYGGGVRRLEDIKTIFGLGIEKVVINSHAVENPAFIRAAADFAGSQSVVVSIDVKRRMWGRYEVCTRGGKKSTGLDPVQFAKQMEESGAGELLLTSIDRDGTMKGYDLPLIQRVAEAVSIPVVACGGAATVNDLAAAIQQGGASAAGAGSMFVFQGPHRGVLISYPKACGNRGRTRAIEVIHGCASRLDDKQPHDRRHTQDGGLQGLRTLRNGHDCQRHPVRRQWDLQLLYGVSPYSGAVVFQNEADRARMREAFVVQVKAAGRGKPYDCIVGLSGGADSSWALDQTVHLGLRPLAVHMDNGWNSELRNTISKTWSENCGWTITRTSSTGMNSAICSRLSSTPT